MSDRDFFSGSGLSERTTRCGVLAIEQIKAARLVLEKGDTELPYTQETVFAVAQLIAVNFVARSMPN